MNSIRKWFYKPKRSDTSLLAQFYYSDEELNAVAVELDSFDGRKDPERCASLVNKLRQSQDKVLNICNQIMDEVLASERVPRDFRAKFPDDLVLDNLAGQLWFGAECLAAGSSIVNRELESAAMRPLAKALTKTLDSIRNQLRDQSLRNTPLFSERLCESLRIFDRIFAEFELSYVSAMVPVKSASEYHRLQDVIVLFSETLDRALRFGYLTQDAVEFFDPALMFTIPRLAIVNGLILNADGPLNVERDPKHMSELFRPFRNLLCKIRDLLRTLSSDEMVVLEKSLCSQEISKIVPDVSTYDFAIAKPEKIRTIKSRQKEIESCLVEGCEDCARNRKSSSSDEEAELQQQRRLRKKRKRSEVEGGESKLSRGERKAWELRRRFKSTEDLLHRLFVCISGVADQLQTNFASELRTVLKTVFQIHMPEDERDSSTEQVDVQLVPEGIELDCSDNAGEAVQLYEESAPILNFNPHLGLSNVFLEQNPVPALDTGSYLVDSSVLLAPPAQHGLNSPESCKSEFESEQLDEPSTSSDLKRHVGDFENLEPNDSHSVDSGNGTTEKEVETPLKSDDDDCTPLSLGESERDIEAAQSNRQIELPKPGETYPDREFGSWQPGTGTEPFTVTDPIFREYSNSQVIAPIASTGQYDPYPNRLEPSESYSDRQNRVEQTSRQEVDDIRNLLDMLGIGDVFRSDAGIVDLILATPPEWVPDELAAQCMQCCKEFTVIRRRHHCRNCGKVFCNRCSARTVPLPRFGYNKPVRVCEDCFKFQLSHFNITDASIS